MYGVRSWKCDHLRNANCGHRRSAQSVDSTCKKRPHASNCSEKHFFDCLTFLRRHSERAIFAFSSSAWHGCCQLRPLTRGNHRSLMSCMARTGACVQLHIENFWTKPGKWDHLKNRTTYSQSLRWSYFPGLTVITLPAQISPGPFGKSYRNSFCKTSLFFETNFRKFIPLVKLTKTSVEKN